VERPDLMAGFVPAYMMAAAAGASLTPLMTRFVDKRKLMMILIQFVSKANIGNS
jgi:GPH family glycoside/pentoside/hexuronide:cation symporter